MICINADEQAYILQQNTRRRFPSEEGTGFKTRRTSYGNCVGAVPVGNYADALVDPRDYKETINYCNREKIFTMYHQQNTWAPDGFRWNQNGLNYCWAWGITAAMMDQQARINPGNIKLLAPVTMGWTVGWRNKGNYLEDALQAVIVRGVAEASYVPDPHSLNYREYKAGWEDNALLHRVPEDGFWDLQRSNMIQHAISVLKTGTSLYVAYYWWSHALEVVGLRWNEREKNNLEWILRNAHNEDELYLMTGDNAIPDEAIGIREKKQHTTV
jgi:hypothetical protein